MVVELEEFQVDLRCPKCGSVNVLREYVPAGKYVDARKVEHLRIVCHCKFEWATKTRDAR